MTKRVSESIVVNMDVTTVFDVLADPTQHALFDGSGHVKGSTSGPPRLYLGATFGMRMHWFAPYLIKNTVVEFEEDRRIAWRHFARHVWRYALEPVDTGSGPATRVTETFDWAPSPIGFTYGRIGIVEHNTAAITATLQRLKVLVESRALTPQ
jgi:hypothetical protein